MNEKVGAACATAAPSSQAWQRDETLTGESI